MSTSWNRRNVLAVAAAWNFTPYDAETRSSEHASVVISSGRGVVHRAEAPDGMSTAELIAHVRELAGDLPTLWSTHEATGDLADHLSALGASVNDELDVIAYELGFGLPELSVPSDVEVVRIDSPDQLPDAYAVTSAVFGMEPSREFREGEAAALARDLAAGGDRNAFRYLAYADGNPVGHAGTTLDGEVVKLWGGSVLEDYRGRGAYRALLHARLADAVERGGRLALVKARIGTSSPILRRAGFTAYGREVQYLLAENAT